MKRSLIISFIGFCFVAAITVVIILNANGYTINTQTGGIEKTGIIKISATPSGSTVFLDNKNQGGSPVSVFNLTPGQYLVTVEDKNYITWNSEIKVRAGQISLVYPILYPTNTKTTLLEKADNMSAVYFGTNMYAYSTSNTDGSTNIYTHSFGSSFLAIGSGTNLLFSTSSLNLQTGYTLENISFAPDDSNMLLTFQGSGSLPTKYYIADTTTTESPTDLDTLVETDLYTSISWGTDGSHLVLNGKDLLISLNITTGEKVILAQNSSQKTYGSYGITSQGIYYSQETNSNETPLYTIQNETLDGIQGETEATLPSNAASIIGSNGGNSYAYSVNGQGIYISNPTVSNQLIHIPQSSNLLLTPLLFSPDMNYLLYKDSTGTLYTYTLETTQIASLQIHIADISSIIWDKQNPLLFYTIPETYNGSDGYYSIHAVNYDGSNNDLLFTGPVNNPYILIDNNSNSIIFEMHIPLTAGNIAENAIYSISIKGI